MFLASLQDFRISAMFYRSPVVALRLPPGYMQMHPRDRQYCTTEKRISADARAAVFDFASTRNRFQSQQVIGCFSLTNQLGHPAFDHHFGSAVLAVVIAGHRVAIRAGNF